MNQKSDKCKSEFAGETDTDIERQTDRDIERQTDRQRKCLIVSK